MAAKVARHTEVILAEVGVARAEAAQAADPPSKVPLAAKAPRLLPNRMVVESPTRWERALRSRAGRQVEAKGYASVPIVRGEIVLTIQPQGDIVGTSRYGSGWPYGGTGTYVDQRPFPFVFWPIAIHHGYYGNDVVRDDIAFDSRLALIYDRSTPASLNDQGETHRRWP